MTNEIEAASQPEASRLAPGAEPGDASTLTLSHKRGAREADGLPLEFPMRSPGETQMPHTVIAEVFDNEVIRALDAPVKRDSRLRDRHAPPSRAQSGHAKLRIDHALQADRGMDFGFPVGASGAEVTRGSH